MSKDLPLVSICVPTYNAASTVRQTLESILGQRYPNLVVHVSDNASSDDTVQVVESIKDSRLILHRSPENIGAEGNFNKCIRLAEGKYTAIFHADDVYEPDMVEKQVAYLEANPQAGAVFTEAALIDETGARVGEIHLPEDVTSNNGLYDFETMFKAVLRHSNFFICPSVMARTSIYQHEIGCWRGEQFKSSADLDLWLRILLRHPVGYLREALIRYRISRNQWSARVRLGTGRADFFLVMDHYLAMDEVRPLLSNEDIRNYGWLERRDRVMRAVNLLLEGQAQQGVILLNDIFSLDALNAAIRGKRGLMSLLLGVYVLTLTRLRLDGLGKWPLRLAKQMTGK